jgi:hypothetical protein
MQLVGPAKQVGWLEKRAARCSEPRWRGNGAHVVDVPGPDVPIHFCGS